MAKINEVLAQTEGGRLLMQFKDELFDCLVVPNSWLPEEMRDRRTSGRTLNSLNKKCEKRDALTPHQIEKMEKARRIASYAAQLEKSESFEYDVDEDRLNDKMITFCSHAVRAGMMELDPEDFEDLND